MDLEMIERQQREWGARASAAQASAAQAYARLLSLAEERDSGQIRRVVRFLASTYNGNTFPFDLYELRAVDVEISDDMLMCLDALRWAKADLHSLVPNGEQRVRAVITAWGVEWPETS
jgi:uncharacterized protein involved in exopolysaccharide biosynthesis